MRGWSRVLLVVVVGVAVGPAGGCRKQSVSTPRQGAAERAPAVAVDKPQVVPDVCFESNFQGQVREVAESGGEPERIERLLDEVTKRQQCNIVMGCAAEGPLVAAGDAAVAPIIARYRSLGRPTYQKYHLIDLLGLIGDSSALPFLRDELKASHWEARTRSALAIGRMGARSELARLKGQLAEVAGSRDYAYAYALAFAVESLSGEGGRDVLLEGLSPASIGARNWGYTRVAVEAAADLKLTSACPLLRVAVTHKDIFLKKAAIQAAEELRCQEAALLNAIAAQLPHQVPSVRRAARQALRNLTGTDCETLEEWQSHLEEEGSP